MNPLRRILKQYEFIQTCECGCDFFYPHVHYQPWDPFSL
jgi:hypothetical protein